MGRTAILSARQDSALSVTIHASHTLAVFGKSHSFQCQDGNRKEEKRGKEAGVEYVVIKFFFLPYPLFPSALLLD